MDYGQQHLTIAREIGDRAGEGIAFFNMGEAMYQLGDHAVAIAHAETALKIFEEIKDPNASKVRDQLAQWREQN